MKIKPYIMLFTIFFVIIFISTHLYRIEQELKIKEKTDEEIKARSIFTKFTIKNTIVAGSLAFVIGLKTRDIIQSLLDCLINPFFKDKDDIVEIGRLLQFKIGHLKFDFTDFALGLIKFFMFLLIIYIIVIVIYVNTDYITLK